MSDTPMSPNSKQGLTPTAEDIAQYNEQGYMGPFPLFEPEEAKIYFNRCFGYPRLLLPWAKGRHTVVKALALLSKEPQIISKLRPILGDNILLWGSMLIRQKASAKHPIHVDVEHFKWKGVSVWIGIENVISGSSFGIITRTHSFNISPEELHSNQDINDLNDSSVLEAAKRINPNCRLVYLDVKDGEFIIFNGKLWHGTKNNTNKTRSSILLQYTTPDNKTRIAKNYVLPNTAWYDTNPSCLLVSGEDNFRINKLLKITNSNISWNRVKSIFQVPTNAYKKFTNRI